MEKISIIVPVFNVEKYIQCCVESLLFQTYSNVEIILVDDGSTDHSSSLCDNLAITDMRITVVHKPNGGVSESRNYGLDISGGAYVTFCDSDDWIEPQTIETAYKAMSLADADVAIWSYYGDYVDANNKVICRKEYKVEDCVINQGEKQSFFLQKNVSGHIGYVWNKLYMRSVIEGIRFYTNLSLYEDLLYNSIALTKANRIHFLSLLGSHYIQRGSESLGKKKSPNQRRIKLTAIDAKKRLFRCYGLSTLQIIKALRFDYWALFKMDMGIVLNHKLRFQMPKL